MKVRRFLPIAALAALGAWGSGARPPDPRFRRLEIQFEVLRRETGTPGLSAALARNGRTLWCRGFGRASLDPDVPAGAGTLYRAASLTKTMVAVTALKMAGAGLLNLDQTVPLSSSETVPLWSLLSHTSESPVPGDSFRYSDRRYRQVEPVLLAATGKTLRVLLMENILIPLRLHETVPGEDARGYRRKLKGLARSYSYNRTDGTFAPAGVPGKLNAAGGLVTSVRDLVKYGAALDGDTLLPPAARRDLFTPRRAVDGRVHPYALGWYRQRVRGVDVFWHYGFLRNAASALLLKVPSEGLTFALLANADGPSLAFEPALSSGAVTASAFADEVLRLFVFENPGAPLPDPDWARRGAAFAPVPAGGYDYRWEKTARALMDAWRDGGTSCVDSPPVLDPAADNPSPAFSAHRCDGPGEKLNSRP